MIYFFHGTDTEKTRAKAFEWIAKARGKEPNLVYARIAREDLTDAEIESSVSSGGLFVKRLLLLFDDPDESVVEHRLKDLAESDNAIVILAPGLAVASAKKIAAKAVKTYEFRRAAVSGEPRGFNSALANALAARSREKLWLEIVRALRAGDRPETIHGILHWKARDLMQKGGRAWTQSETRDLSLSLIAILQDSRAGASSSKSSENDMTRAMERFALSI